MLSTKHSRRSRRIVNGWSDDGGHVHSHVVRFDSVATQLFQVKQLLANYSRLICNLCPWELRKFV